MPYPCTDDPNEILEYVGAAKSNAQKFDTFVNGTSTQTVQLGIGDPTPTIRKFIAEAQSVVATAANDAAETVLDTVADMKMHKADKAVNAVPGNIAKIDAEGNFRDAGRAAEDFVLLLAYANDESLDLALFNRMNVEVYKEWYARGVTHMEAANIDAVKAVEGVRASIGRFDGDHVRHRLQQRLFAGANPTSSSKPVLFVVSGQSNGCGWGSYKPYARAVDCGTYWSWGDGSDELKPIADPVGNKLDRGSAWPAFAKAFFSLTGRKAVLLNIAEGGSAVTPGGVTWASGGTLRAGRQAVWDAFSAAVPASGYDLGGILWVQGEAEANRINSGTVSVQDYVDATLDVLAWTRTLVGDGSCPVFIGKIGSQSTALATPSLALAYEQVREAQDALCEEPGFYMGFAMAPYYALPLDAGWYEYMSDAIHYSRLGYRIMGESFARCVANRLFS